MFCRVFVSVPISIILYISRIYFLSEKCATVMNTSAKGSTCFGMLRVSRVAFGVQSALGPQTISPMNRSGRVTLGYPGIPGWSNPEYPRGAQGGPEAPQGVPQGATGPQGIPRGPPGVGVGCGRVQATSQGVMGPKPYPAQGAAPTCVSSAWRDSSEPQRPLHTWQPEADASRA